jgi:hypothetical protein
MVAKRERGECYNCTEKFSREHLKVCPVKGVFLLQMEEDDLSTEETEADPLISLNAITGISQAETTVAGHLGQGHYLCLDRLRLDTFIHLRDGGVPLGHASFTTTWPECSDSQR